MSEESLTTTESAFKEWVVAATGNAVIRREAHGFTHQSMGQLVDLLAARVRWVHYHAPRAGEAVAEGYDYVFSAPNLTVHPWPFGQSSIDALLRPHQLLRGYWRLARSGDVLVVRGSAPFIWTLHWMARLYGKPIVHWVAGNPLAVLRAQSRGYGKLLHQLGIAFAWLEQRLLQLSHHFGRGYILANGHELARIFRNPRTLPIVSTTIREQDLHIREDTCTRPEIRLLFIGFIRPEKGLEYLFRAFPLIESDRPVQLAIVGTWGQFPKEYDRLCKLADELGLTGRIGWEGYAPFGPQLFGQMDRSDILVLPSLSEGTPHVLMEARGRSLPIVSTRVGGIPSMVDDGVDGLLVEPGDPAKLAQAVSRVIHDGEVRRALIVAGRERVRNITVDRFADLILDLLSVQERKPHAAEQKAKRRPAIQSPLIVAPDGRMEK